MAKRKESIPLSDSQVKYLLDGKVNIIPYTELKTYRTIEDVLYPHDCAIILYLSDQNYGHWTAITKRGKKICWFDPYGLDSDGTELTPDQEKDWPGMERWSGKDNILSHLFRKFDGPMEFNSYPFQKHSSSIATCGRHCVVWCCFSKKMCLDSYAKMIFSSSKTPDQIVTYATDQILKDVDI
jgi:hypothetical protein